MDIKNCTYYFFDYMININILDQSKIKINEKSCKNILNLPHWTLDGQRP